MTTGIVFDQDVNTLFQNMSQTFDLSEARVKKLLRILNWKPKKYFNLEAQADQEAFISLYESICRRDKDLCDYKNCSLSGNPKLDIDIEEFFVDHIHEAIIERIGPALVETPEQIQKWYDFSVDCEINKLLVDEIYHDLLTEYCGGLAPNYRLCLHQHHNLESDYYLALVRSEKPSWRRDPELVAVIGFRQVDATTWSIDNLQGKVKAKGVWGNERSNMTNPVLGPKFREFNELAEFNWRKLLVYAGEELAKSMGIERMLFRPGEYNFHYNKYNHGPNTKYGTNFFVRYDGTARQTGYKRRIDTNGKKVYVKYLVPFSGEESVVTLPANRPGDGFIMH